MDFQKVKLNAAHNATSQCGICHHGGYDDNNYAVAHRSLNGPHLKDLFHVNCIMPWLEDNCMAFGLMPTCKTCGIHVTHVNGKPVRDLSLNTQENLLAEAIQGHDLPRVVALSNGISDEERGSCVIQASGYGHIDTVRALLKNNASIPVDDRGEALECAIESGEKELVELLIDNGPISNEACLYAIQAAYETRHGEIRALLLSKFSLPENS